MRYLATTIALVLAAACGGDDGSSAASDARVADEGPAGRCTQLDGKSFSSVELQPDFGMGPDGPVPCHWRIEFSSDAAELTGWTWHHSDVGESGTIGCVLGDQIVSVSGGHLASYDYATMQLSWDDIDYELVP